MSMRVKPSHNRKYMSAKKAIKTRCELPRKQKKAFIKEYGRGLYRYFTTYQRARQHNAEKWERQKVEIQELIRSFGKAMLPSINKFKTSVERVNAIMSKFGDMLAKDLAKYMPQYSVEVQEGDNGVLITHITRE